MPVDSRKRLGAVIHDNGDIQACVAAEHKRHCLHNVRVGDGDLREQVLLASTALHAHDCVAVLHEIVAAAVHDGSPSLQPWAQAARDSIRAWAARATVPVAHPTADILPLLMQMPFPTGNRALADLRENGVTFVCSNMPQAIVKQR